MLVGSRINVVAQFCYSYTKDAPVFSLSLPPSLTLSPSLSLPLSRSLPPSLSPSPSLTLSLSLSLSLPLSLSPPPIRPQTKKESQIHLKALSI